MSGQQTCVIVNGLEYTREWDSQERMHQELSSQLSFEGDEARSKRGSLQISHLIEDGAVQDWDNMKNPWSQIFQNKLIVSPDQHPVLLLSCSQSKINREKMTQIIFETFVQFLMEYCKSPRILCRHTACSGTLFLRQIHWLKNKAWWRRSYIVDGEIRCRERFSVAMNVTEDIKEKLCFVVQDYEAALQQSQESYEFDKSYELPDGQVVSLGSEKLKVPEYLLNPQEISDINLNSLHYQIFQSITDCDIDTRRDLYQNIVLAGGTSNFNNNIILFYLRLLLAHTEDYRFGKEVPQQVDKNHLLRFSLQKKNMLKKDPQLFIKKYL
ncbi:UNKNOWN [Stylonychia lemnae]|uniref:Actin, cytoplasmic n=1 Tax=Stylonychia lemnae TaxID=5949 RepID=A0A078A628_STYLE|nr:UNKNOWN [Stylonychia lemnae]|eukprot:CDW77351.1 UNKNOWN [Stylonychia lemnae]